MEAKCPACGHHFQLIFKEPGESGEATNVYVYIWCGQVEKEATEMAVTCPKCNYQEYV
jgi:DNA-directed RNA polymerase subunit RPC12/RpoP